MNNIFLDKDLIGYENLLGLKLKFKSPDRFSKPVRTIHYNICIKLNKYNLLDQF